MDHNDQTIKKLLLKLGITNIDQLNDKDLDYWWNKKYIQYKYKDYNIDEKNNDLIELNNAKDFLLELDINKIKLSLTDNKYNKDQKSNYENNTLQDSSSDTEEYSRDQDERISYKLNEDFSTQRTSSNKENDELKNRVSILTTIIAIIITIIIIDQVNRQDRLFRIQCAITPSTWFSDDIENHINECSKNKWLNLFSLD